MKKFNVLILSFILSVVITSNASAQGLLDGFTPTKDELTVTLSYTNSSFDEFYVGETKMDLEGPLPFDKITQNIVSLYAKYGITDKVSAVLSVPFISAESGNGVNDPINGVTSFADVQDISIAIKANAAKFDFKSGNLNLITGLTTVIPTGYEANGVLSAGSGAWGVDYTAGLHLNTNVGLFSTIFAGYNLRDGAKNNQGGADFEVPNAFTLSGKLGYASEFIYVEAWAYYLNSDKGVDIGGPNFTGNLPETNVENSSVGLTLYKNVIPQLGVSLSFGQVIDGRNIGAGTNYSAGLTYCFKNRK